MPRLALAVLASLALVPSAAHAKPAAPRSLVLLVDEATFPNGTAGAVTSALRSEVVRSANYTWQDPPPVSMDELLVALSCKRADIPCLQKMGPILKADVVVLASVTTRRKRKEMSLLFVQFKPTEQVRKNSVRIKKPEDLAASAGASLRSMLGPIRKSVLVVLSQPEGAQVDIDGKPAGVTPLTLDPAPLGPHALHLTMAGFKPQDVSVEVGVGERREVRVTLSAEPVAAAPKAKRQEPEVETPSTPTKKGPAVPPALVGPMKWAMVALGGSGAALAGIGAVAGLGMMAFSGLVYGLMFIVQAMIPVGRVLVYPLSFGGGTVVGAGLLLLPLGVALVVGGFVLGVVLAP